MKFVRFPFPERLDVAQYITDKDNEGKPVEPVSKFDPNHKNVCFFGC